MDGELLLGIGRFVLATTLLLLLTVPTAFIIIQMEMKIIAQLALRYGPNRIGPRGLFQSTIHGFKVLAKEDTIPDQADRATFTLAPWMVYMAAAMSMLVIPFAPGAIAADWNIGIVYFFAVLGLSVVGLLVAGWAIFYISSLAEINRTPFDMIEADSELVAGPFTEYSGMRFGFFFFAEYVALFIMSGILVSLFFGGWLAPWPFPAQLGGFAGTLWGILWFFLKTYFFVFVAVWLRATLPRVRVDQLMGVAWKVLLPLALVNLFITAIAVVALDL